MLDPIDIAKKASESLNAAVVITGKEDVIVQDQQIVKLSNGSPLLANITGAGCLLGGVVASFLFRNTQPSIEALIEAVVFIISQQNLLKMKSMYVDQVHSYLSYWINYTI